MSLVVLTTLILLSVGSPGPGCNCAGTSETTRAGANEQIVVAENQKYSRIAGSVSDINGEILSDVLVEVFDQPDHLLLPYSQKTEGRKPQRRIAACVAGNDGQFCFANIPRGKYEVRFSKNGGWKHLSMVVSVVPRSRHAAKRKMEITMQVGT